MGNDHAAKLTLYAGIKCRWLYPTPRRMPFVLPAVEGILLLKCARHEASQKYRKSLRKEGFQGSILRSEGPSHIGRLCWQGGVF